MSLSPAQRIATAGLQRLARMLVRSRSLHADGAEQVPATGPVLFASRHYHHFWDGCALVAATERRLHLAVALDWVRSPAELWAMQHLTRLAAWPVLLRAERVPGSTQTGACLFHPDDVPRYALRCARQCVDLLVNGGAVVLFPEGYPNIDPHYTPKRTHDEVLPFRDGFARLAKAAAGRLGDSIPVVPVGLDNPGDPPRDLVVRFGPALMVDGATDERALVRQVEARVRALCAVDLPNRATAG